MVVATPDGAADIAHRLHAALLEHGLRIQISVVSAETAQRVPHDIEDEARKAAFCVVLSGRMHWVLYALIPAPQFIGQRPRFAKPDSTPDRCEVEAGVVVGDVAPLVARVVERTRAR